MSISLTSAKTVFPVWKRQTVGVRMVRNLGAKKIRLPVSDRTVSGDLGESRVMPGNLERAVSRHLIWIRPQCLVLKRNEDH